MRRIDELHLDYPFAGSRMLRDLLRGEGVSSRPPACRHADEADGDRGDLPSPEHVETRAGPQDLSRICCAGWRSTRPNQVWAMDITYIPMARGFVYLAAVVDWFSRRVLAWRRVDHAWKSTSASRRWRRPWPDTAGPRSSTPIRAASSPARPSPACCSSNGIAISMDGKGAWRDNVFVERLWRSVKYEEVYLRAYDSVGEARASLGRYLDFYNRRRPHSSLDARTPDEAYFDPSSHAEAA